MHQQDMRPTRNIRVNRHRENKFVEFAVVIIEMILSVINTGLFEVDTIPYLPDVFNISRVDPSMGV